MAGVARYAVPFIRPVFPSAEELSIDLAKIVESNWYTNFGPYEREFATKVAEYIGPEFCGATFSNATIGLIAAISTVLGRGDGSQYVMIPSFTFAAGAEAIEWSGYRPLFIDVETESLQPSLKDARLGLSKFGKEVAGVLLCNTFGIGNRSVALWENFSSEFELPLIVDSAAGFGSLYAQDSKVGTAGVCEVFSFHATKPFAIGEGGAVVTRDHALAARLAEFTNFGFRDGKGAAVLGLNGKLQELSAAIGLRQFERFDEAIASRRLTLQRYMAKLSDSVRFPDQIELSSVCFATILTRSRSERDGLREALEAASIEARAYYSPPLHLQPHFIDAARASALPVTTATSEIALSIPVHEEMRSADESRMLDLICERTHR